jgi:hypothetical protein
MQSAGPIPATPPDELIERVLRGVRAGAEEVVHPGAVIQHAVQHDRAHPPGKPAGVLHAEQCAVRGAVEADPLLPQRGPQRIGIADHAQRVDVVVQRAGPGAAIGGQPPVVGQHCVVLLPAADQRRRRRRHQRTGAEDRVAAPDATRVEADDVEPGSQCRAEHRVQREVDAGLAGPAGVHHQRADPVRRVGRRPAGHRHADPARGRVGPVDRDGQRAALRGGVLRARAPSDSAADPGLGRPSRRGEKREGHAECGHRRPYCCSHHVIFRHQRFVIGL